MNRIVTINVTDEDIRLGLPKKGSKCPVALALNRLLLPNVGFGVGGTYLTLNFFTTCTPLPQKAQNFIVAFDKKARVEPFSFELSLPEEVLCLPVVCEPLEPFVVLWRPPAIPFTVYPAPIVVEFKLIEETPVVVAVPEEAPMLSWEPETKPDDELELVEA